MNSKALTTGQAASLCSVTPDTVLKWIRSGRLAATRTPGGHHRISQDDILRIFGAIDGQEEHDQKPSAHSSFQFCWEFNGKGEIKEGCGDCIVYKMRAKRCYEVVDRASALGHNKLFCKQTCDECDYFRAVHQQATNVLLVTDNDILAKNLTDYVDSVDFNLEVTNCEYQASAIVDTFRPDFAIIDCSLGKTFAKDICDHLIDDPRIPYIRVVLAAVDGEYPEECNKKVFARLRKPFNISDLSDCIGGELKEVNIT
jgi:excisionase family DNA binding protein